jgi:hypothetical protein
MTYGAPTNITIEGCQYIAKEKFGITARPGTKSYVRSFSANFGVVSTIAVYLWNELVDLRYVGTGHTFVHLLWTLGFLKTYSTEEVLCCSTRSVSHNTHRKWVWMTIEAITKIKIVSRQ